MPQPGRDRRRIRAESAPVSNRIEIERSLAALAGRQHGVVARAQLLELGLSPAAIGRRLENGRLHSVHRGVYAVGHARIDVHGRWLAAVLACGPGSLLSHLCAASVWELLDYSGTPHVTVSERNGRRRPGIVLHRPRALHEEDRATRGRIPVTSVARTLVDVAGCVDDRRLRRAVDQADRLHLLKIPAVERACARASRRRGVARLQSLLAEHRPPPQTRSELEDLFLDLCREFRLPLPETNILVAGYEVDAYWPDVRLIVELDGFEFHRTRAAFEHDRARDAELKLAGNEVIRLTAARIRRDPARVAETVGRLLRRRY